MKLPSPQNLAIAIAQTSLDQDQKEQILENLPTLTESEIIDLYQALIALHESEIKFLKDVKLIDLKYQVKLENALQKKS